MTAPFAIRILARWHRDFTVPVRHAQQPPGLRHRSARRARSPASRPAAQARAWQAPSPSLTVLDAEQHLLFSGSGPGRPAQSKAGWLTSHARDGDQRLYAGTHALRIASINRRIAIPQINACDVCPRPGTGQPAARPQGTYPAVPDRPGQRIGAPTAQPDQQPAGVPVIQDRERALFASYDCSQQRDVIGVRHCSTLHA